MLRARVRRTPSQCTVGASQSPNVSSDAKGKGASPGGRWLTERRMGPARPTELVVARPGGRCCYDGTSISISLYRVLAPACRPAPVSCAVPTSFLVSLCTSVCVSVRPSDWPIAHQFVPFVRAAARFHVARRQIGHVYEPVDVLDDTSTGRPRDRLKAPVTVWSTANSAHRHCFSCRFAI